MEPIRSSSNPLIKRARAAVRGKERGLLALEGDRLVEEALRQGFRPEALLVGESRQGRARELSQGGFSVQLVDDSILDAVSSLTTSAGILALVPAPVGDAALPSGEDSLVVVAAGTQDPGNLGALARTAEAAGASALVSVAGGCSPWNPKALRGSMGSLLRLPVRTMPDARQAWEALAEAGYRNVCARTRGATGLADFGWGGRLALWVFAETGEVPEDLRGFVDEAEGVSIPMAGGVESLNVTAAAAVLLFAAGRNTPRNTPDDLPPETP